MGEIPLVFGLMIATGPQVVLAHVSLAYHDWRTAILLALPVTGTFVIFHAYTRERQRHLRIEFLYESARELSRSSEIGPAMKDLLARALEAFPRRGGGGHLLLARRGPRAAHHRPAGR